MLISEVVNYVKARCGDADDPTLLGEIINTWKQLWLTLDAENSMFEIDFNLPQSRIVTMPWYVYQLKYVKRANGQPTRLNIPRAYYEDHSYRQSALDWRPMHRTPLMTNLAADGQLRFKLKKKNGTPFTLSIRGPGNYGVNETEDITFQANDTEQRSQAVFADVQTLSKSATTLSDVEVYDVRDNLVTIIPADRTEVWCQVIRVVDKAHMVILGPYNYYTALYKAHPPTFSKITDVIPDDWGIVLQQAAVAERLGTRKDELDQKRQGNFAGRAVTFANTVSQKDMEGQDRPITLRQDPFTPRYHGYL